MEHMQEAFFQQLYETWFPKLCRYVASAVHDPHAAEEIVQDTFLAALGNLALLIQAEYSERWLLKTAKYKTLHYSGTGQPSAAGSSRWRRAATPPDLTTPSAWPWRMQKPWQRPTPSCGRS